MNETAIQQIKKIRTQKELHEATRTYCEIVEKYILPVFNRIHSYKVPKMVIRESGFIESCEFEYTDTEKKLLEQIEEFRSSILRQLGLK